MYLLDTNVISEFRKISDGKADRNVVTWQETIDSSNCYLSAVTIMELQLGIARLARRQPDRNRMLSDWFEKIVLPEFKERILFVDTETAMRCATLHVHQNRPHNDAWIAATALVNNMIVVTRNEYDFASMNVRLLNPWQPQG